MNIRILIEDIRSTLEAASFLVSRGGSEKEAHSKIIQSLVLLAQLEMEAKIGVGKTTDGPHDGSSSNDVRPSKISNSHTNDSAKEVHKVRQRIPKWFDKPNQINSKILLRYLELRSLGVSVTPPVLKSKCHDISDFEGNFNQMKNYGGRNHGKVFDEIDGAIVLWGPVSDFILEHYEKYKGI